MDDKAKHYVVNEWVSIWHSSNHRDAGKFVEYGGKYKIQIRGV